MGTIQLKRGNGVNFAGVTLQAGEPVFVLDTGKLYMGDGTNKILINPDQANAETATKLTNSRLIGVSGDATGSASFDGSANSIISLVLANTGVGAGTYTKVTVDSKGRITSATNLSVGDIPTLTLSKISDVGTSASKNTGVASGNIPILDASGKLDISILPALAITDTFVVATQVAMLALTAEVGDVSIRTDLNKSYILKTTGATTFSNWQELLTPTDSVSSVAGKAGTVILTKADVGLANVANVDTTTTANITDSTNKRLLTDAQEAKVDTLSGTNTGDQVIPIQTVAGRTGAIVLTSTDVGLGNVTNTTDASKPVSTAQQTALNLKANLVNPTFTGAPTAPTATVATNTTQIATTAFVKAQGYLTLSSNMDGGTF